MEPLSASDEQTTGQPQPDGTETPIPAAPIPATPIPATPIPAPSSNPILAPAYPYPVPPYPAPPSTPYPLPPNAPYGYEAYAYPNPAYYPYPYPHPYSYFMPTPTTSGWAIASMVCSIVGFVLGFCGFLAIGTLLGIIFGHIGLHEIKRSDGMKTGRGFAIAGLVTGYIGLGLWALYFVFVFFSAFYTPPA